MCVKASLQIHQGVSSKDEGFFQKTSSSFEKRSVKFLNDYFSINKKALASVNLQELYKVLEAGLEPAQPLLAKGF